MVTVPAGERSKRKNGSFGLMAKSAVRRGYDDEGETAVERRRLERRVEQVKQVQTGFHDMGL